MSKDVALNASRRQTEKIKASSNSSCVKLAIIDAGIKKSIIENFSNLGCDITVFPAFATAKEILRGRFDAVLISNGPGDPQDAVKTIETARELIGRIPMFGICLGYQILSIVLGAKTYKMKYGHRGGNHPVINLETNKVIITSQNHGYAADISSLPKNVIPTFKNLNDGTLEGFRCPEHKIEAVQFHPEAAPGPYDANQIIEDWIAPFKQRKRAKFRGFMKKLAPALSGKNE
jgi:carbamoyl-phosphate synthase small subunit